MQSVLEMPGTAFVHSPAKKKALVTRRNKGVNLPSGDTDSNETLGKGSNPSLSKNDLSIHFNISQKCFLDRSSNTPERSPDPFLWETFWPELDFRRVAC